MLRRILRFGQGRLWDGPWLPALPGSPRPIDADDLAALDAEELSETAPRNPAREAAVADLAAAVRQITHDELPDDDAREALLRAIYSGEVIGVYTPVASPTHTIEIGRLPRYVDPRIALAQWMAWWRTDKDPANEIIDAWQATQGRLAAEYAARERIRLADDALDQLAQRDAGEVGAASADREAAYYLRGQGR